MDKGKLSEIITRTEIENMIGSRDFAKAEGHVPELVSVLLQSTPELLDTALKVSLENKQIKKEMISYIHETSSHVIEEHSSVIAAAQKSISDTNQQLIVLLNKIIAKEEMSSDDIRIYYETLQEIKQNDAWIRSSVSESEEFFDKVQNKEIDATKHSNSQVLDAVIHFAQTPQGSKLIVSLGKALYRAFAK